MCCHRTVPFHGSILRTIARDLPLCRGERQRRSIGKHNPQETSHRSPVLDRLQRDSHFVSHFERLLAEPLGQNVGTTLRLDSPMHHLTISPCGVEAEEAMRIAPEPLSDRSLHRDFLSYVELRGAVVCE